MERRERRCSERVAIGGVAEGKVESELCQHGLRIGSSYLGQGHLTARDDSYMMRLRDRAVESQTRIRERTYMNSNHPFNPDTLLYPRYSSLNGNTDNTRL